MLVSLNLETFQPKERGSRQPSAPGTTRSYFQALRRLSAALTGRVDSQTRRQRAEVTGPVCVGDVPAATRRRDSYQVVDSSSSSAATAAAIFGPNSRGLSPSAG